MKKYEIWQDGRKCADPVYLADSFLSRFRGLMLRKSLLPGEGLLLKNCPAIHCCFMRFPIDAVYLDEQMGVLDVETVYPWRLGKQVRGARHVLELEKDQGRFLVPGIRITIREE